MTLTNKQIRSLKGLAHPLNPVVQLGKSGYSPAFIKEVGRGLMDHELIKVRLGAEDRGEFEDMAARLANDAAANLVATVGRIAVLYKRGAEGKVKIKI